MMPKPDYDTTLARIAGNIAPAVLPYVADELRPAKETGEAYETLFAEGVAMLSVRLARAIVAEVRRTTPREDEGAHV